ncbi:MAG: energy-coupling factor transporter transmembrane protein EcfT [Firmicutes bacterium]|nr:energy-coupling factor transporter transmembrane protein EcfT [Bacillota bacterium]MCL1953658.1 energy-coupling factor transporter transmembrane protein EcfT [Bacillota bacterium]
MRDITFGQYYPSGSITHRLDPRLKILLVATYITMVFYVPDFWGYGIVAFFVIVATILSKVPIKSVLRSIRPIIFLVAFTSIITILFYSSVDSMPDWEWWIFKIYKQSLYTAGYMACRLILLVLGPALLTLTTTPVELTDGLEWWLSPFKLVKLPVHTLTLIMSIALRFIPTLIEETGKIINAQKARCADFDSKNIIKKAKSMLPVLIPLFVSSFRRGDELADALDSRCYNGAKGRTRMKQLRFGLKDLIAFLFLAVFFVAILNLSYHWIWIK